MEAWTVAAPLGQEGEPDPRRLRDTHGDLRRIFGLEGEFLCLMRPDGHVGLIQIPIDEVALLKYLDPPRPMPFSLAG